MVKVLTPTLLGNAKKNVKTLSKVQKITNIEKTSILEKSVVLEKDKGRKLLPDKKKKQVQTAQKKNKSFTTISKRSDM